MSRVTIALIVAAVITGFSHGPDWLVIALIGWAAINEAIDGLPAYIKRSDERDRRRAELTRCFTGEDLERWAQR